MHDKQDKSQHGRVNACALIQSSCTRFQAFLPSMWRVHFTNQSTEKRTCLFYLQQGRPEVTEDGDIVYVFDDLQESATGGMPSLKDMSTKDLKALAQTVSCKHVVSFNLHVECMTSGVLHVIFLAEISLMLCTICFDLACAFHCMHT